MITPGPRERFAGPLMCAVVFVRIAISALPHYPFFKIADDQAYE